MIEKKTTLDSIKVACTTAAKYLLLFPIFKSRVQLGLLYRHTRGFSRSVCQRGYRLVCVNWLICKLRTAALDSRRGNVCRAVAMPHIPPLDKWPCHEGLLWLLMTTCQLAYSASQNTNSKVRWKHLPSFSLSLALSESYREFCDGIYATTRGPWTAFGLFLKKGCMNKKGKCCHLLSQGV